jgi:hypothetical protein
MVHEKDVYNYGIPIKGEDIKSMNGYRYLI